MFNDLCSISGGLDYSNAFRDIKKLRKLTTFMLMLDEFLHLHQFFKGEKNSLWDIIRRNDLVIDSVICLIFFLDGSYNIYL